MNPKSLAKLLRVISTQSRLEILQLLIASDEALPTSLIAASLGHKDGMTSYNLGEMADVGILMRTQSGKHRFYTPNRQMLRDMQKCFDKESTQ